MKPISKLAQAPDTRFDSVSCALVIAEAIRCIKRIRRKHGVAKSYFGLESDKLPLAHACVLVLRKKDYDEIASLATIVSIRIGGNYCPVALAGRLHGPSAEPRCV